MTSYASNKPAEVHSSDAVYVMKMGLGAEYSNSLGRACLKSGSENRKRQFKEGLVHLYL